MTLRFPVNVCVMKKPGVQCRCRNVSAVSAERGAGGRGVFAGGFAGSGRGPQ